MLSIHSRHSGFYALFLGLFVLLLGSLACQALNGLPSNGGAPAPTAEIIPTTFSDSSGSPTQPLPGVTQPQATLPPPTATQPQAPEAPVSGTDYEGIRFSFDPSVARDVSPQIVPAYAPPQDGAPGESPMPEYIRFNFNGYPLTGTFFVPKIEIYPVAAYESANPDITTRVNDLQNFLREQPGKPQRIPFLPLFNAEQLLRAGVQYIGFKNGSGVRFLTEYTQYFAPVNNQDLFYTYQGITNDGKYYVSAIFPISHPTLPADASVPPPGGMQNFSDNFPKYVTEMEATLSGLAPSSFTPDLAKLDAIIQSLEITR